MATQQSQQATSGLSAADFNDVNRSDVIAFEKDTYALREQVRQQMFSDIRQAIKNKKNARIASARGNIGAVIGGLTGAYLGDAKTAYGLMTAGNYIGRGTSR